MGEPGLTQLMGSSAHSAGFSLLDEYADPRADSWHDVSLTARTRGTGQRRYVMPLMISLQILLE